MSKTISKIESRFNGSTIKKLKKFENKKGRTAMAQFSPNFAQGGEMYGSKK